MATLPCVWCGLPLHFVPGKGWLHENGQLYITRPDGSDDHCGLPDRSEQAS